MSTRESRGAASGGEGDGVVEARTIRSWARLKGIEILDYDGFTGPADGPYALYTEAEFSEGVALCTVRPLVKIGECSVCGPLYAGEEPCGHTALYLAGFLGDAEIPVETERDLYVKRPTPEPVVMGMQLVGDAKLAPNEINLLNPDGSGVRSKDGIITTIPGPDSVAHTFRAYPGRRTHEDAPGTTINATPTTGQGEGEIVRQEPSSREPVASMYRGPRPEGGWRKWANRVELWVVDGISWVMMYLLGIGAALVGHHYWKGLDACEDSFDRGEW